MKSTIVRFTTSLTLLAAIAIPVQLAAQGNKHHSQPKHHHYQLVDLGSTFGGPQSQFNPGSGNDFLPFASVLNGRGTVAGFADTSASDPFQPFCFWDCAVAHAFRAEGDGGLTDLGALPGAGNSSGALGVSANGLIAGLSENGEVDPLYAALPEVHAVLWQQGTLTDLGTLPEGGYQSEANSVNSAGEVVGSALNTVPDPNSMQPSAFWLWGGIPPYQYQTRAFLWDKQKGMQDLGALPGGTNAQAILINERGQVVGWSYTSSAPSAACPGFALTTGSFIWDKKNGMRDLGNLGGTCTLVSDLNNRGQVIGVSSVTGDASQHAFLWERDSIQDLGGSLGGNNTGAFVVNDHGQAVGFATLPGETAFRATLWKHVGEMTDLGAVGNDQCSYATGINTKGQVVGGSITDCIEEFRAFLWEDGSIFDLNALIPPGSALYLTQTFTINDRGEIAGEGDDADGNGHAFLAIPCDENHLGVEGCDYSLVDVAAASQSPAPRYVPSGTQRPGQSRRTNRYPLPGPQPPSR
jgi:probable HAF family extracellular repeat protein